MKAKRKATKTAKPKKQPKAFAWPEPTAEEKAERKRLNAEIAQESAENVGAMMDVLRPKIEGLLRAEYAAKVMPSVLPYFVSNVDGKFSCDMQRVAAVALILADKLTELSGKTDAEISAILRPPQPENAEPAKEAASPA